MPTGFYKRKSFTDSHKAKLSLAHLGKKLSEEHKRKLNHTGMLGKRHNPETIIKMRLKALGKKHSLESRRKMSVSHMGKKIPYQVCLKRSVSMKGKNTKFKNGISVTPINKLIRDSLEYRLWREAVFKRDNYACIWCDSKSGNGKAVILNADHIKRFADYPELRFAIDNGRTLCKDCHYKTDTYGRRKNTNISK